MEDHEDFERDTVDLDGESDDDSELPPQGDFLVDGVESLVDADIIGGNGLQLVSELVSQQPIERNSILLLDPDMDDDDTLSKCI